MPRCGGGAVRRTAGSPAVGEVRVSVIVPVYNGERFLAEALDSVLAQSSAPYEIIVVDDGSTDGTPEVAARYRERVRYLRQDNAGPAAARNAGLMRAGGEVMAFLDADDLWHPDKLARQAARFAARPELGISLAWMRNFWVGELAHEQARLRDPLAGTVAVMSLVARRELFARVGLLDCGARHKDVIGWLIRARQEGAMVETLPEILVYRRIHRSNLSRRRGDEDARELLDLAGMLIDSRRLGRGGSR